MIKFFNKSLILFKKTLCAESKVLVLAKVISFFKNKIDPFFGWSCYFVYAQILDVHVDCPVLNTIITKKVFRRFAEACNFIKKETPTEVPVKHSQAISWYLIQWISQEFSKLFIFAAPQDNCFWYLLKKKSKSFNINLMYVIRSKSSCPEVFCKKGALRNFARFTGKHLCWRFFFNKVAG